jgi:ABC-type antimicrobial peptide transport system permease subunit
MLVGLLVAGWLTKFIESQLYHVNPRDPVTIALVVACFVVIALLAASGPARRASRVDPITALRCE